LWEGFKDSWPLMVTPDMAVNGDNADVLGPAINFSYAEAESIFTWLPFWNTVVVALGIFFLCLQAAEYSHALHEGLFIDSGAYGTTFYMLTGFHGAHVTLGTFMLLVMWIRSIRKNHFTHDDCFGFESASWYWHFVDVVWLGLFIFVYILG